MAMTGEIALALAKSYVDETLNGEGALKGEDGKSAYQIALDNGFVGTQEQWLESLKGVDGKDGANGKDGKNGENGKTYTPAIGTITKGDNAQASISVDEAQLKANLNFTLPKGDKGEKGEPGPQGPDGNPVGTIIAFMGTTAPAYYLKCDGSVYNISAYPTLANHIKTQFGRYDYFEGNGTTTFAVPDLRGEFLRGVGTANRNTGSGGAVGTHQDPTYIPNFWVYTDSMGYYLSSGTSQPSSRNSDTSIGSTTQDHYFIQSGIATRSNSSASEVSVRPTNTSVLYCIKYQ